MHKSAEEDTSLHVPALKYERCSQQEHQIPSLFPLRSTSGGVSVRSYRTGHLSMFIPSVRVVDFSFQK